MVDDETFDQCQMYNVDFEPLFADHGDNADAIIGEKTIAASQEGWFLIDVFHLPQLTRGIRPKRRQAVVMDGNTTGRFGDEP